MKNTLKSIKEFIKSDWKKTSEEIALLPSKIKKIIWKIWSYRRFGVWFLVFLMLYVIWRMRPANFPDHMPEESEFLLPEIAQISTGENLIYSFVKPELKIFKERTDNLWSPIRSSFLEKLSTFPKELKQVRLLQRGFMRNPYRLKELDQQVLSGRVSDITLDVYFSSLSGQEFNDFQRVFDQLSWLRKEIEEKDRVVDPKDEWKSVDSLNVARNYAKTLNFFAGYQCTKGNKELCIEYLKTSYLLWVKISQRNTAIGASYGLGMREEALLLMLYLHQEGKINLRQSGLYSLIKTSSLDSEQLTIQTIKMSYWWVKSQIERYDNAFIPFVFPLFDKEDTIKMLQVLTSWQLGNLNYADRAIWERWKVLDKRLFDRWNNSPFWAYERTDRDQYLEEYEELLKVFWRKNVSWIELLGIISSSPYLQAKTVEDYEHYILNYL